MSTKTLSQLFTTFKACNSTNYFQFALPDSIDFTSEAFQESGAAGTSENDVLNNLFLFHKFDHYCFPKLSSARSFNYEFKPLWNLIYKKYYQHYNFPDNIVTELSLIYSEYHIYLHNALTDLQQPTPSLNGDLNDSTVLEISTLSHRARFLNFQIFCDPIYRFKIGSLINNFLGISTFKFLPTYPLDQYANSIIDLALYYNNIYGSAYNFSIDPHTVVFNSSLYNLENDDDRIRINEYIDENEAPFSSAAEAFIDRHSAVLLEYGSKESLQDNDIVLFKNDLFDAKETYISGSNLHLGRFKDGYIHYTPSTDFGMAVKAMNLSLNDDIIYVYRIDPSKFI